MATQKLLIQIDADYAKAESKANQLAKSLKQKLTQKISIYTSDAEKKIAGLNRVSNVKSSTVSGSTGSSKAVTAGLSATAGALAAITLTSKQASNSLKTFSNPIRGIENTSSLISSVGLMFIKIGEGFNKASGYIKKIKNETTGLSLEFYKSSKEAASYADSIQKVISKITINGSVNPHILKSVKANDYINSRVYGTKNVTGSKFTDLFKGSSDKLYYPKRFVSELFSKRGIDFNINKIKTSSLLNLSSGLDKISKITSVVSEGFKGIGSSLVKSGKAFSYFSSIASLGFKSLFSAGQILFGGLKIGFKAVTSIISGTFSIALKGAKALMVGLGTAAAATATAIYAAIKALKPAAKEEDREQEWTSATRSSRVGKSVTTAISALEEKMPFDDEDIDKAARRMYSFGILSVRGLRAAGQAAAFLKVGLADVVTPLGQLSKGVMREQSLAPLGITKKALAQEGVKFSSSGQMQSSGAQAYAAAINILNKKFGGTMEAKMKTWNGLMATMGKKWENIWEVIGGKYLEPAKKALESVLGLMDKIKASAMKITIPGLNQALAVIRTITGITGSIVEGKGQNFIGTRAEFTQNGLPFKSFRTGVGGYLDRTAPGLLNKGVEESKAGTGILGTLDRIVPGMMKVFNIFTEAFSGILGKFLSNLGPIFSTLTSLFVDGFKLGISLLKDAWTGMSNEARDKIMMAFERTLPGGQYLPTTSKINKAEDIAVERTFNKFLPSLNLENNPDQAALFRRRNGSNLSLREFESRLTSTTSIPQQIRYQMIKQARFEFEKESGWSTGSKDASSSWELESRFMKKSNDLGKGVDILQNIFEGPLKKAAVDFADTLKYITEPMAKVVIPEYEKQRFRGTTENYLGNSNVSGIIMRMIGSQQGFKNLLPYISSVIQEKSELPKTREDMINVLNTANKRFLDTLPVKPIPQTRRERLGIEGLSPSEAVEKLNEDARERRRRRGGLPVPEYEKQRFRGTTENYLGNSNVSGIIMRMIGSQQGFKNLLPYISSVIQEKGELPKTREDMMNVLNTANKRFLDALPVKPIPQTRRERLGIEGLSPSEAIEGLNNDAKERRRQRGELPVNGSHPGDYSPPPQPAIAAQEKEAQAVAMKQNQIVIDQLREIKVSGFTGNTINDRLYKRLDVMASSLEEFFDASDALLA